MLDLLDHAAPWAAFVFAVVLLFLRRSLGTGDAWRATVDESLKDLRTKIEHDVKVVADKVNGLPTWKEASEDDRRGLHAEMATIRQELTTNLNAKHDTHKATEAEIRRELLGLTDATIRRADEAVRNLKSETDAALVRAEQRLDKAIDEKARECHARIGRVEKHLGWGVPS